MQSFRALSLQRLNVLRPNLYQTRSTQRAQTSLAEADHYSHILPTVKMLSLGCERLHPLKKKKKKKGSGSLPAPRSGYATTIMVFFSLIYSSYNTQITTKI